MAIYNYNCMTCVLTTEMEGYQLTVPCRQCGRPAYASGRKSFSARLGPMSDEDLLSSLVHEIDKETLWTKNPDPKNSSWEWFHYVGFALAGYVVTLVLVFALIALFRPLYISGLGGTLSIVGSVVAVISARQYKEPTPTVSSAMVIGIGFLVVFSVIGILAIAAESVEDSLTSETSSSNSTSTPNVNVVWNSMHGWTPKTAEEEEAELLSNALSSARAHLDKGEYQKAAADFAVAIRIDDTNPSHYINRGSAFYNMHTNQYLHWSQTSALKDFLKALELEPENQLALSNAALAYQRIREKGWIEKASELYRKSIEISKKAVELYPEDAKGYYTLGRAYYDDADLTLWKTTNRENKYKLAAYNLKEAIRLDPNHGTAYCILGDVQLNLYHLYHWRTYPFNSIEEKQLEKYLNDAEQNLTHHLTFIDPNDGFCYYTRSLVYKYLNEKDKAAADFSRHKALLDN